MMRRRFLWVAAGLAVAGVIFVFGYTPTYALDEHNCLSCHGNPDLTKTNADGVKISLYVSQPAVDESAHRYIDCTTCHTTEPHQVATPLTKLSLAEKCGSCHQYQYQQHLESIHGQRLVQGNPDVATCVDCHSPEGNPHSVIRVLEYTSPAYKANIAQTCAKCHNNEALMGNYGIVEKVYESYMRSFHGKAMQLSGKGQAEIAQLDVATCTNCHGTHDIKSVSDPTSPVAGLDNLAKTCDECHSGAGVNFASSFLGHREASPQNIPVAYYAEKFFGVLLFS
ncbi:MAG: cytochrome c3 family protein, partial [Chloroflexota bacterium]